MSEGIITILAPIRVSEPPARPIYEYKKATAYYYKDRTVGMHRQFEAQKANMRIDRLVTTPYDGFNINTYHKAQINDTLYDIKLVEVKTDHRGIEYNLLTLAKGDTKYVNREIAED